MDASTSDALIEVRDAEGVPIIVPSAAAAAQFADAAEPPPPWLKRWSATRARVYYSNPSTGSRVWECPEGAPPPPPPPSPPPPPPLQPAAALNPRRGCAPDAAESLYRRGLAALCARTTGQLSAAEWCSALPHLVAAAASGHLDAGALCAEAEARCELGGWALPGVRGASGEARACWRALHAAARGAGSGFARDLAVYGAACAARARGAAAAAPPPPTPAPAARPPPPPPREEAALARCCCAPAGGADGDGGADSAAAAVAAAAAAARELLRRSLAEGAALGGDGERLYRAGLVAACARSGGGGGGCGALAGADYSAALPFLRAAAARGHAAAGALCWAWAPGRVGDAEEGEEEGWERLRLREGAERGAYDLAAFGAACALFCGPHHRVAAREAAPRAVVGTALLPPAGPEGLRDLTPNYSALLRARAGVGAGEGAPAAGGAGAGSAAPRPLPPRAPTPAFLAAHAAWEATFAALCAAPSPPPPRRLPPRSDAPPHPLLPVFAARDEYLRARGGGAGGDAAAAPARGWRGEPDQFRTIFRSGKVRRVQLPAAAPRASPRGGLPAAAAAALLAACSCPALVAVEARAALPDAPPLLLLPLPRAAPTPTPLPLALLAPPTPLTWRSGFEPVSTGDPGVDAALGCAMEVGGAPLRGALVALYRGWRVRRIARLPRLKRLALQLAALIAAGRAFGNAGGFGAGSNAGGDDDDSGGGDGNDAAIFLPAALAAHAARLRADFRGSLGWLEERATLVPRGGALRVLDAPRPPWAGRAELVAAAARALPFLRGGAVLREPWAPPPPGPPAPPPPPPPPRPQGWLGGGGYAARAARGAPSSWSGRECGCVRGAVPAPAASALRATAAAAGAAGTLVSISAPRLRSGRRNVDVCILLDVSGSMGAAATRDDAAGNEVQEGLTVLCLAKQAVLAVAALLTPADRLAVVTFESSVATAVPLRAMDGAGEAAVRAAMAAKGADGGTEMWGGLKAALALLAAAAPAAQREGRLQSVLLLTDGNPTSQPPAEDLDWRGGGGGDPFASALRAALRALPAPPTVHAFGFGYNLAAHSGMLLEVARAGGGVFAFVPTAPVLADVFLHAATQLLTAHGSHAAVGGARMGALQAGTTRTLLLPAGAPLPTLVGLPAGAAGGGEAAVAAAAGCGGCGSPRAAAALTAAVALAQLRGNYIRALEAMLAAADAAGDDEGLRPAQDACAGLVASLDAAAPALCARAGAHVAAHVAGLRSDAAGRVRKALEGTARYQRWGCHYLRALLRAHEVEACTNPLDAGLQAYAGPHFAPLVAKGLALFHALPPPPGPPPGPGGAAAAAATPAPPTPAVNAGHYTTGGGGGCFAAGSTVRRLAPRPAPRVPVSRVRAGDTLALEGGARARVALVVELPARGGAPLVALPARGGIVLTPGHPVRWRCGDGGGDGGGGGWRPAREVPGARALRAEEGASLFNFVMEGGAAGAQLLVGGTPALTLGHGLREPGAAHAFYGGQAALRALQRLPGWREGRVRVARVARDAGGRACGFVGVGEGATGV
jgi:hypothetical protein